ncbi:response regulator transcription factor [Roseateles saccharophilus]|uniref:DNA-binding NarL/FixJ family response regulator n=2 Tax=Roseateles saccharophilus TaxID=304 RepID=A0A4R3VK49_ROSSA|nr:DNA-binding NarL/FixJ family response regulator [Roseateles saccharophilus]
MRGGHKPPPAMPTVYLLRHGESVLQRTRSLLLQVGGIQLAGCKSLLADALDELATLAPDIVACDLRLVDSHAMRAAHELGRLPVRPQLLLLTPTADDLQLFAALSAGANAYHVDDGSAAGLVEALARLHERRAMLSPQLARQALAAFGIERSPLAIARQAPAALDASPAGRQIDQASRHLLTLLAQGLLLAEVATLWKLDVAEIERRIWRTVRLLHVRSRELLIA